ncbi:MAG: ATP-binding protein [Deltaproteobacteria bacterium]|nr:ATP-binding protein [Deltaproteobacteria bacterium]
MPRTFNTAGPCRPEIHYMLPPERRLPGVRALIDQQAYFVLHAPRQVGKTTSLLTLGKQLTAEGRFAAVMVSMEMGAAFPDDIGAAEAAILEGWRDRTQAWLPPDLQPPPWPEAAAGSRIGAALKQWAVACPRPLVVFLDEIDALRDQVLVSVLRQLRNGHANRPGGFPWSLALVGLRDVRDYKVASGGSDHLGTSSPFNIKVESITLRDFDRDEVASLYAQHTDETGQDFEVAAIDRAFALTQGQPWLVNALARQLVEVVAPDRSRPVTAADVERAKGILIERQDTHLDSLAERLHEPRIRAIVEPMLAGTTPDRLPEDDVRFAIDLGLVRQSTAGGLEVANPIYREVIVRHLLVSTRASLPQIQPTWLDAKGRLVPKKLLTAFLSFWKQHGEVLQGTATWQEVAAHLVLMAFLHRVANGGGSVEREYAIGRGRMDLRLTYGADTLAIEVKTWRTGDKKNPVTLGLKQFDEYLEGMGLDTGWLVIFDQRAGAGSLAKRTRTETAVTGSGRKVTVVWG